MKKQTKNTPDWKPEAAEAATYAIDDLRKFANVNIAASALYLNVHDKVTAQIKNWMDAACEYAKNADYYRGLLVECGEQIGKSAYKCDDGSYSEDVLCAKIPELVKELIHDLKWQNYVQWEPKDMSEGIEIMLPGEKEPITVIAWNSHSVFFDNKRTYCYSYLFDCCTVRVGVITGRDIYITEPCGKPSTCSSFKT